MQRNISSTSCFSEPGVFFFVAIECFVVGTANDNEVYIYMLN